MRAWEYRNRSLGVYEQGYRIYCLSAELVFVWWYLKIVYTNIFDRHVNLFFSVYFTANNVSVWKQIVLFSHIFPLFSGTLFHALFSRLQLQHSISIFARKVINKSLYWQRKQSKRNGVSVCSPTCVNCWIQTLYMKIYTLMSSVLLINRWVCLHYWSLCLHYWVQTGSLQIHVPHPQGTL